MNIKKVIAISGLLLIPTIGCFASSSTSESVGISYLNSFQESNNAYNQKRIEIKESIMSFPFMFIVNNPTNLSFSATITPIPLSCENKEDISFIVNTNDKNIDRVTAKYDNKSTGFKEFKFNTLNEYNVLIHKEQLKDFKGTGDIELKFIYKDGSEKDVIIRYIVS